MSQLTNSADIARVNMPFARWFAIVVLIAAVLAVAAIGFMAAQSLRSAEQAAAPAPAVILPGTRGDDYGLRHPVQQTSSNSRLDDYGLRHPVQHTSSESRLDDYGLRHPTR